MRVTSVNRGQSETVRFASRTVMSGINKHAQSASVTISVNGVDDDVVCDELNHGGVDQAVYAYNANDYTWWSRQLGREVAPGTFGDNLTIDGLPRDMNAGDRLLIGDVLLEATAPRIPCRTLAAKMQDGKFGIVFRRAERPGFYFRVLNAGEVAAGDNVTLVENPELSISMLELFRLSYKNTPSERMLQRALDAPIAVRMRAKFEKKLAALSQ